MVVMLVASLVVWMAVRMAVMMVVLMVDQMAYPKAGLLDFVMVGYLVVHLVVN